MAEYILREAFAAEMKSRQDAAKEWLIEATGTEDADGKARAEAILSFLCEVKLTLEAIPAADVRTVVHGRWLEHHTWAKCSECGYLLGFETPYCPNCGADMRDCPDRDTEKAQYCNGYPCRKCGR